jgi:precorrin-6A/cobalt-precorrin-6A reductase
MILLLGGTSETAPLAEAIAEAGFAVLVSTATDVALEVGNDPGISRRIGPLDTEEMVQLAVGRGIKAIVDASHPYASAVHAHAKKTAEALNIPYLSWSRPSCLGKRDFVSLAQDHEEAARMAFSLGQPVLLTTGSRNLSTYAAESARTGIPLVARVLDHPDSLRACEIAGILPENVITGRGPFSLEENLSAIREFHIKVIVTKDSGPAGGVPEKEEAARLAGCKLVVIQRPHTPHENTFNDISELIAALTKFFSNHSCSDPTHNR